jgi:hypothetical protein
MRTSLTVLGLFLFSVPAAAQIQGAPAAGMKHMTVSPQNKEEKKTAPEPVPETKAEAPARKALTVEQALVKPADLKNWSHMDEVVVLSKPEDVDKMIRIVEADPGAVPPTGLLFLAKALSDHKRMEEAALYFYVAQLRTAFDAARWPPRADPEEVKRVLAEKKKSSDQTGQVTGAGEPRYKNPHNSVVLLSSAISEPISSWLFEDPARADIIMARVKEWDASAPYAYLPGYQLPEPVPFEEWGKILQPTRDGFFARMNEFISGLKKLKTPKY